jgi:PAT family beta-lactamase induction signal transducer AmpG
VNRVTTSDPHEGASGGPSEVSGPRAAPWVASTYFAQGLPYSIVHQVAAELFTALGAPLAEIGLTSLYGLAWNLKFLWSPAVDRIGTTRRWLLLMELVLGITIAALAWPADARDLHSLARALVLVSIASATHDIAVDGFYLRALDSGDQAALSGLRVAAYRVALIVGKGGLVALAGWASWRSCFLAGGAILLLLALAHALLLPKPEDPGAAREAPRPSTGDRRGSMARHYVVAFETFLRRPNIGATLALIVLFRAGDALMFAMSPPFLNDLGLALGSRGVLNGVAGAASIAGSLVGGVLIARRGLARTLLPIAVAQSVAILLYVWLARARPGTVSILSTVVVEQFVAGIGTAALVVFVMRQCSGEYKATHFACGTALASVAATVAGSASGYLANHVGFTAFFALAFVASTPGVAFAWLVARTSLEDPP